jgi:heme O synthase-like polyprenyltransferase
MHWVYLTFAIIGGFYFLYHSIQLMIKKTPVQAKKTFFASIIQLGLLLVGAMMDAIIFV